MILYEKLMVSIAGRKSESDHYWWNYGCFVILSLCGDCCEGPGEQPSMTILFEQREVINFIRKSVYKLDRNSKFLAES